MLKKMGIKKSIATAIASVTFAASLTCNSQALASSEDLVLVRARKWDTWGGGVKGLGYVTAGMGAGGVFAAGAAAEMGINFVGSILGQRGTKFRAGSYVPLMTLYALPGLAIAYSGYRMQVHARHLKSTVPPMVDRDLQGSGY